MTFLMSASRLAWSARFSLIFTLQMKKKTQEQKLSSHVPQRKWGQKAKFSSHHSCKSSRVLSKTRAFESLISCQTGAGVMRAFSEIIIQYGGRQGSVINIVNAVFDDVVQVVRKAPMAMSRCRLQIYACDAEKRFFGPSSFRES
jgi:hypothetical protein